jgi:amidohydrolase
MKTKKEMKEALCSFVDAAAGEIEAFARSIESEPELGYKETKTAAKAAAFFTSLGLPFEEGLAVTGVRASLAGAGPGPTVAVLGELDAVGCPEAPLADPLTGAAHTCGHFLQMGAMMGAAKALSALYKTDALPGRVVFFAVPAEEYVEIAYRNRLRAEGKLHYLGGKQELIYRDEFKGVDMAMMVHSNANTPQAALVIGESSNGFVGKTIQYVGKEAHAAAAPHEGVNALNAAILGLMGIHALRETFRDEDHVRVHPIITKGGDLVNSVPADVTLETYVRARTMDAIEATHKQVDRALRAGGDAVGAETIIHTIPGYLPLASPPSFNELFIANAQEVCPGVEIQRVEGFSGSTEVGDLSHLIPTIQPFVGGVQGSLHGRDFSVHNFHDACLLWAKVMACTTVDLLYDGGKAAKEIIKNHKPLLTREQYISKMDAYFS